MFRRGFEPAIPASEGPQTHALDRAGAGFGKNKYKYKKKHTEVFIRQPVEFYVLLTVHPGTTMGK